MTRLAWLSVYALAMALVEAAIVVHLRHLYHPADPQAVFPLVLLSLDDLWLEMARELATVIMIGAVAMLAERGWPRWFAAFVFVFGLWDLGYYAWLKLFLDWPRDWFEWDVLFLIPWPWFGPWLAPALIALLFVLWGGWILTAARQPRWTAARVLLFAGGALLGLVTFLAPGWPLLAGGAEAFRGWQPGEFGWAIYAVGFIAMTVALVRTGAR